MKSKKLYVPTDCEGALATAIRIRIIYLQSYREQCLKQQLQNSADCIMADIANLTMLQDNLAEAVAE